MCVEETGKLKLASRYIMLVTYCAERRFHHENSSTYEYVIEHLYYSYYA